MPSLASVSEYTVRGPMGVPTTKAHRGLASPPPPPPNQWRSRPYPPITMVVSEVSAKFSTTDSAVPFGLSPAPSGLSVVLTVKLAVFSSGVYGIRTYESRPEK